MDLVGQRLRHIRIVRRLGHGGMGEVFEGFDETLQRRVAVKMLHPERRLSAEHSARFLREARILSQLDHPGICRVHELITTDEADFLVLEFIEGRSLRAALDEGLTRGEVLRIVRDLADALTSAHERDIVHRDLKPENVMITAEGQVKILDFGIARSTSRSIRLAPPPESAHYHGAPTDDAAETVDWDPGSSRPDPSAPAVLTRLGTVIGTVAYMSPEQAAGEACTAATDLFSLGIMLYEMATGQRGYGNSAGPELLLRVYRADVDRVPLDDPDLERLVDRLLQLSPDQRPTAAATAAELGRLIDRPRRRRQRRLAGGALAAVTLLILVTAGTVIHSRWQIAIRARLAESFARRSQAMAWQLRAEYLSPLHDLDPVRRQLQTDIDTMSGEIATLDAVAAGPGRAAIGRTLLSLGDVDGAAEQLQLAWDGGHRPPEVAYALGVARAEQYRRADAMVSVLRTGEAQAAERTRIRRVYRDPAVAALRAGASSAATFPAYAEGLIALLEDRIDDALAAVRRLEDAPPWFYEKALLEARIHRQRAIRLKEDRGRTEEADECLLEAERALRSMAATAPSHPGVFSELCESLVLRTRTAAIRWSADARNALMAEGENACATALRLDPNLSDAHLLLGRLDSVRAVLELRTGTDPTASFERAVDHVDRALQSDPDSFRATLQRGFIHDTQGWSLFQRDADAAMAEFRRAIEDYRRAVSLPTASPLAAANIANAAYGPAALASIRGEDPTPWTDLGLQVLDPLLADYPDNHSLWGLKGNLATLGARWAHATHGRAEDFDTAVDAFRRAAEGSDDPMVHCNFALSLSDRADLALTRGEDPSAFIARGLEAADAALAISPDFGRPLVLHGLLLKTRAAFLHSTGADATPVLDEAIDTLGRGLAASPDLVQGSTDLARLHLLRARVMIDNHRSPADDLEAARGDAEQVLGQDASEPSARAVMVETALLEARVADDPGPLLVRAATMLTDLREGAGPTIEVDRLEVGLWLIRAERGPLSARSEAADRALVLAEAASERHPWDADAALDVAEARARRIRAGGATGTADASSAEEVLQRALELNPNLANHPRVRRIRGLLTDAA
jgi:tetratricopeptide (TPR) repeat protein/predicted Ser/Thr protein kinase